LPQRTKPPPPKFASFQPKKTKTASNSRKHRSSDTEDSRKRHRHHLDKHTGKSEEERHHKSKEERRRPDHNQPSRNAERSLSIRDTHKSSEVIRHHEHGANEWVERDLDPSWISDRRGDPLNEQYGFLNRSEVPRYSRVGYGRVIGTRAGVKINRDESNDKKIILDIPDRLDYPGKSVLSKHGTVLPKHPQKIISDQLASQPMDHEPSFLPLRPSKRRKIESEKPGPAELLFRNDINVGDITRDSMSGSESESELASEVEFDVNQDAEDAAVRQRNVELTIISKQNPRNIQSWRDLIKHQDDMIMLGRSKDVSLLSLAEKRNLADIKISIYREALTMVLGDQSAEEELWLGMLHESESVLEDTVLLRYWKEAVDCLPKSRKIRLGYINFFQTTASCFQFGAWSHQHIIVVSRADYFKNNVNWNISIILGFSRSSMNPAQPQRRKNA
jgi:NRDE-2, necessary for RNA interference